MPPMHPLPSTYSGSGRGGSSFSREAQTSLSPATWASSSGGTPRRSQPGDIVPPACPGSSSGPFGSALSSPQRIGTSPASQFLLFKGHECLKCEAGWEQHGGNCYKFNTRKFSWNKSRDSCKDLGGDLVKIDSREEELMMENFDKFWIGLTDSEEEDRWLWVDGSPLEARLESISFYPRITHTEADDLNNWFDSSCDVPHKSICDKIKLSV
uniref:C-type lectin domain-containing protein n=1 Tax=Fundulus heteroclitus TaxID=8078 RepID=A0A3Q2P8A6_FUNHE